MKKSITYLTAAALAVSSTPALAGGDTGDGPSSSYEALWELNNFFCNVLGIEVACRWLAENPRPGETTTPPPPGN